MRAFATPLPRVVDVSIPVECSLEKGKKIRRYWLFTKEFTFL